MHEIVMEWLRFADADLAASEHLLTMHPIPIEIICYHCQQSAEKYLKGYLVAKGVEIPPKTHDLDILHTMCKDYDEDIEGVKTACSRLTIYEVQPRYPDEIDVTEDDMHRALDYARQIRDCQIIAALRDE